MTTLAEVNAATWHSSPAVSSVAFRALEAQDAMELAMGRVEYIRGGGVSEISLEDRLIELALAVATRNVAFEQVYRG